MRPLANGGVSFWCIVENLHHAVDYFPVTIRVNVDARNVSHVEELLVVLARAGLAGRVSMYPGQIVGVDDGVPAPSASYRAPCLTNPQFAQAELEFAAMARRHGFARPSLPAPTGAERPARLSGPTSWSSGVGGALISAGTQWATAGRSSVTFAIGRT
jgi:uncharacterized protein